MKEVRITASAALFLLAVVGLVWAQGDKGANPPKAAKLDDALRLESDLVTVDVVATDAQGNFVPGLTAADFQVYEDDKLQKVEFFEMSMRPEPRPLAAVIHHGFDGRLERLTSFFVLQNTLLAVPSRLDLESRHGSVK